MSMSDATTCRICTKTSVAHNALRFLFDSSLLLLRTPCYSYAVDYLLVFGPCAYAHHAGRFGIVVTIVRDGYNDFDVFSAFEVVNSVIDQDNPANELLVVRDNNLFPGNEREPSKE